MPINRLKVVWRPVEDAVDYRVAIVNYGEDMNSGATPVKTFKTQGKPRITTQRINDNVPPGAYSVQVRALATDPADNSDWSYPMTYEVYISKLSVPANVSIEP